MNDEIVKLRESLVELSTNPTETQRLLDKLTEEEILQSNINSLFHVDKNEIIETKDLEFAKIYKTRTGYVLSYRGGYNISVDNKILSATTALQQIMDGVPAEITDKDEREGVESVISAAELIFRLPMFVFSHMPTTLNLATIGVMYMNLLQKMGEVPTEETENPEYDKFLVQMNELMENFAAGLEKEGKEYEKRMND